MLCFLMGSFSQILPQNPAGPGNTTDRLIEGGNLIIEVLKVISNNETDKNKSAGNKEADCAVKNFTNICFVNRSSGIISVKLKRNDADEEHELLIDNNGKECCYRITPGIFTYSIGQKTEDPEGDKLIRKGEILLEACKDIEIKIK